jgi:hypothetical protein
MSMISGVPLKFGSNEESTFAFDNVFQISLAFQKKIDLLSKLLGK